MSFKAVPAALTFLSGALTFPFRDSDFFKTPPDFFKRDYGVFGGGVGEGLVCKGLFLFVR